jgi:hypothetical protein
MVEMLSAAIIIGVRYGAVRQQGPNNEKIIDYQSHQWNLMPVLAGTFATMIAHDKLKSTWLLALESQHDKKKFLSSIQYWHGVSAALKSWNGWWTADALETVRRSLGGHAYSAYSGIGLVIADFAVCTTGAGDNIVMAQQSAKYLLSVVKNALKGREAIGYTKFLADRKYHASMKYDQHNIVDAFRWLCAQITVNGAKLLHGTHSESEFDKVWNENMMEIIPTSRLFSHIVLLECFSEFIQNAEQQKKSKEVIDVLNKLYNVFSLSLLLKESGLMIEHGHMTGQDVKEARMKFSKLCKELRRDAVPLVDSFRYPDFVLNSALGRYDGDIYKNYFNTVLNAPGAVGVPPYFEESIAPLTRRSKL